LEHQPSFSRRFRTGVAVCGIALLVAIIFTMNCARAPVAKPTPAPTPPKPTPPAVPPGFVMKPFQVSMHDEMRKSYESADEVMAGVFTGIREDDPKNIVYYLENFTLFNKETLSWEKPEDVIVEIRPGEFKPEIILQQELKRLVPLDRVGICWDLYQGRRSVYLVEGQRNLVFLKVGLNEATSKSYRTLLDAYPVTPECRTVDVFNLMIRHLIEGDPGARTVGFGAVLGSWPDSDPSSLCR
jgi:hypothetical protein